jgi:hypothetical protein
MNMRNAFAVLALTACGDDVSVPNCPSGGPATTITLNTLQRSQLVDIRRADANLVVFRDGDDDACWREMPASGTGAYELPVTQERYAVAIVCSDPSVDSAVEVFARARDEVGELTASCAARVPETGVHRIGIQVNTAQALVVYEAFLRDERSGRHSSSGASNTITWGGRGGTYDLVAVGHTGDAPDDLLVVRELSLTEDRVIDAHPGTAAYMPFGPELAMSSPDPVTLETHYITRHGTRVPLGEASGFEGPTSGTFATWPAGLVDPGDAYEQLARGGSLAARRIAQRFTLDPSGFAPVLPPAIDSATVLTRDDDVLVVAHPAMPGAALYSLNCSAPDHSVAYNVSAGWHGDAANLVFAIPLLPDDVESIARPRDACSWELVAAGSTGGLATENELANIGVVAGAPAQLAGTTRWLSRRELTTP